MKDNVNIIKQHYYLKNGEILATVVYLVPDAGPIAVILLVVTLLSLELDCSHV